MSSRLQGLGCGCLLVIGLGSACTEEKQPETPEPPAQPEKQQAPEEPERTGVKVLLIGIDGMSLNLLEPLEHAGATPNLSTLAGEGGRYRLEAFWPLRTMQVWTSIVTGKLPGQHGIWDHVKNSWYNPPGFRTRERQVYTSADRRSSALWHLLGERGVKTLVVGWPTTWPAEEVKNGIMVAPKVLYGDERRVTIKGAFWRHVDDMVTPASLLPRVHKRIVEPQEVTEAEIATLAEVPPAGSPLYELPKIEGSVAALRWSLARARSVEAITLDLAESSRPDVVLAYFQCTDSLLHRFWIFRKTEDEIRARLRQFGIPVDQVPELKRRFGKVVENCYRDVDARVGRLLDALRSDDTLVMLVSDHGFGDGPEKHPFRSEPYGGIHWSNGAMLVAGPGIPANMEVDPEASVLDVTPTLLYFLGLPVAGDMCGEVLEALFDPAALEKRPIETIPTYEDEPQLEAPYPDGFPPKPPGFIW